MIINTGMRTDIPAFFHKWFLKRIEEGFVLVRNPFNPSQVTKYILKPNVVDCLSFCTKNPHNMIPHLEKIDIFNQFWFVTITPYGKDIEPNVPDKKQVIEDFISLSNHAGKKSVALRYDPIFINEKFDVNMHIKCFDKLLKQLKDYTEDCTISFLDMYDKVKKNAPGIRPPNEKEEIEIAKAFAKIGKENNITIHLCCENENLAKYGLDTTGCMSKEIIEKAIGANIKPPKNMYKRDGCNCVLGNDIGAYNTCMHLCKYCYANYNKDIVEENMKHHNPDSPFLIGESKEDDKISIANQISWIDTNYQISLI